MHHEDALRGDGAVGPRREVPERTARAVVASLRTSAWLMLRRSPVGVRLVAPGREPIEAGQEYAGGHRHREPVELLLLCYGRMRVAALELEGPPRTSRRCAAPSSACPEARPAGTTEVLDARPR